MAQFFYACASNDPNRVLVLSVYIHFYRLYFFEIWVYIIAFELQVSYSCSDMICRLFLKFVDLRALLLGFGFTESCV